MSAASEGPRQALCSVTVTHDEERVVRALLSALRRIRHGSVQLVVQDSRVVQIDTVEKTRLSRSNEGTGT